MAANGGRVFFDDLGPPWHKHGCTISGASVVPGFADAAGIARWQQGRRGMHGPSASEDALAVRPDCIRGTARIVRRRGKTVAVVEADDGTVAFEVEGAWPGRSSKTVYFRKAKPPDAPDTLEYLAPALDVVAMRVVAAVEMPTEPSVDDFPAIAELGIPEVDGWIRTRLPGFVRGPRLKIGGHVVGVAGRIGRSRVVLLPLAAWFDRDEDDWGHDDAERVANGLSQVREWTGRIRRMLDKSDRTTKDALFRDVFAWLVPEGSWAFDMERAVRDFSRSGRTRPGASLGPPPVHVAQALESEIEEELRETRFGLDDLMPGERAYLSEGFKRQTEKRWLAAMQTEAGLDSIFSRLEGEGVRFQFMGTVVGLPTRWGQQATLPDGRRLLVLLHLSTPELGLAFVHFGAPVEDEYGFETHQADAIFHAKRLATILKFLEIGPGGY
ncbi:hypothetical protein DK427_00420 [Methylobacterium radiodurans]|uniref:Uncharacterized protein n=2 Tax=Methylobacterium radiodurans TaxID=2202828 RepID=A0A2U8VLX9_9HYPH|nr:hypothetical protein DK427_00420 [Methylobacterium radiodurans]